MPARTAVDQYRTWGSGKIAEGVPEHYGVGARLLIYWRAKGWLVHPKHQYRYPWYDPDVAFQIRWLALLDRGGVVLTNRDAEYGIVARTLGWRWAVRDGHGGWHGLSEPWPIPEGIGWPWLIVRVPE